MRFKKTLGGAAAALIALALAGCNDDSGDNPTTVPPPSEPGPTFKPLNLGLLPDTQGNGAEVSIHAMDAALKQQQRMGAKVVLALGDLTNEGTEKEFAEWVSVASKYRAAGMEILPLMGNHEDSYAHTVRWIDAMRPYIPADAEHMPYAEFLNYAVVRENVLIINLRYWGLAGAFPWIKEIVAKHRDKVDHIVIGSHDGLIGAKYGQVREQIVEGTKGYDELLNQYDDIRRFFIDNDVIWVQGHEHQYQRSVVHGPFTAGNKSWTETGGNYRLPYFTQIMSGNASYKGYEFRYGEAELVQRVIQHRVRSTDSGGPGLDVTAPMLSFNGTRVDYQAWYAEHSIGSNADGLKELENPSWTMFDKFSRSTDRCEKIVYPNSIPVGTRPVLELDPSYRTSECRGPDGVIARIEAGTNDSFNRIDSRTRSMGVEPGMTRAETLIDLMRLGYQYLFRYHESWTPNLNGDQRLVISGNSVSIPETTIDYKKHVTLSWMAKQPATASSVLMISGLQGQNGNYLSLWGHEKALPGKLPAGLTAAYTSGGTPKPEHTLPAHATQDWNANAPTDRYGFSFSVPTALASQTLTLGYRDGNAWKPFTHAACVLEGAFDAGYVGADPTRDAACDDEPLVGFDKGTGKWWAVADRDLEVALIPAS